jgi:hypothetical protein
LTLMVLTSIQVDMFLFQTLGCRCFGSNEWTETMCTIELEACPCSGGGERITSSFRVPSQIQCHADAAGKWAIPFHLTLTGIYWGNFSFIWLRTTYRSSERKKIALMQGKRAEYVQGLKLIIY